MATPEEHIRFAIDQAKNDVNELFEDLYLDAVRSAFRHSDGIIRASLEIHIAEGGVRGTKIECGCQKVLDGKRKGRNG